MIPDGRFSRVRFGSRLSPVCLSRAWKFKRWRAYTPKRVGLLTSSPCRRRHLATRFCARTKLRFRAARYPEPLRPARVLPLPERHRVPLRGKLLPLLRSYRLMRQSALLPLPSALASAVGLCRLLPAPAGTRTFPTLFHESFPGCLDPCHGGYVECTCPFLPRHRRPPPRRDGSATRLYLLSDFRAGPAFATAIIPLCSGPQVGCATQVAPTAVAEATWQP